MHVKGVWHLEKVAMRWLNPSSGDGCAQQAPAGFGLSGDSCREMQLISPDTDTAISQLGLSQGKLSGGAAVKMPVKLQRQ